MTDTSNDKDAGPEIVNGQTITQTDVDLDIATTRQDGSSTISRTPMPVVKVDFPQCLPVKSR